MTFERIFERVHRRSALVEEDHAASVSDLENGLRQHEPHAAQRIRWGAGEPRSLEALATCPTRSGLAEGSRRSALAWSKRFGSASGDGSQGIATDAFNNILVVGSSVGAVDFGGGPLPNAGEDDIFVAKLDAEGNHVWSKTFGDGADQYALDVATDPQGCVIVNGIFRATLDFGGTPLVNAGDDDTYVVKLGIDGEHLWSRAFGDSERQSG